MGVYTQATSARVNVITLPSFVRELDPMTDDQHKCVDWCEARNFLSDAVCRCVDVSMCRWEEQGIICAENALEAAQREV